MAKTDYSKQLEALRQLYELVRNKEPIPAELIADAGVKENPRLKDIEKQISATKKKVSFESKKETEADIERENEELARQHGMTLEEFKEKVLKGDDGNRTVGNGDFSAKQTALEKKRTDERKIKEMQRQAERGDFDMEVDYV